MKPILLILLTLVSTLKLQAQSRDLIALANGDFLGMNALVDEKENLFGYISIYSYGKSGDRTKKFEYVLLDKNLNPFANQTFEGDITAGNYIGYINYDGKIVLRPNELDASLLKKDELFSPSSMVIDLKDNSVKKKVNYRYDHGTFQVMETQESWKEAKQEAKEEKKANGFNYEAQVAEIKEGGFLVLEYDDYGSYEKNNRVLRYDSSMKKLWEYEFNELGSRNETQVLHLLTKNENYFYGLLRERIKSKSWYYMLVLDMKTGKELHKKEINDPEKVMDNMLAFRTYSYGKLDNSKVLDDKIILVGRKYEQVLGNYTGLTRLIIDKNTFDAQISTLDYKRDFRKFIPNIGAHGYVEKNFFLDPRDIFFLNDGSIGFLFEKYKTASDYSAQKTTDLVYVYTDKDFKISGAKIFEKEKSKWQNSDYLFSQNLNEGKDLVFFYRDYQTNDETKDKNWNLYINTLIGGAFKQEVIPISSKGDFYIIPYLAKEGYILLNELNRKAKYNQVRLERLNY